MTTIVETAVFAEFLFMNELLINIFSYIVNSFGIMLWYMYIVMLYTFEILLLGLLYIEIIVNISGFLSGRLVIKKRGVGQSLLDPDAFVFFQEWKC